MRTSHWFSILRGASCAVLGGLLPAPAHAHGFWPFANGQQLGWALLILAPVAVLGRWVAVLTVQRLRRARFLSLALDASGDAVAIMDRNHTYRAVNDAYARMLDLDPGDLTGRSVGQVWGVDLYEQVIRKNLEECFRGRKVRDKLVVPIPSLQGRNVEVGYSPVFQRGRVTHAAIFLQDVTRRVQAETALRERETLYGTLVESANSIILRMTPDGYVTFMNSYGQRFFGYAEEEIKHRHVLGLILPETDSEGRNLREMWKDVVKDVDRFSLNQNENVRKNGERAWILWSNRALRDEHGRITEILSIGHDITPLRKSRQELEGLRLALDQAGYGMAVTDLDGKIRYINPAWVQMHGQNELASGTIQNIKAFFLSSPDEPALESILERVLAHGVHQEEMRHVTSDSRTFDALTSVTLLRGPSHEPDGLVVMAVDVSERKRLLADLEQSRKRLKVIMDNIHDIVFSLDPQGRFTYVSPALRTMFGYSPSEVEGRHMSFLTHADDMTRARKVLEEISEGDTSGRSLEVRGLRKDGATIWLVVNISCILGENGALRQIVGVVRDMTEHRRITNELEESRERFRELVRAIEEAYWLQEGGRLVYVSPGFEPVFGLPGRELQDEPARLMQVVHPEDQAIARSLLGGQDDTGSIQDVTLRVLSPGGSVRHVRARTFPVVRGGRVVRTAGVAQDVTAYTEAVQKQRAAKELAEKSNRVKSEFLARMGHEFRTPLNGVLGMLQLLALEGQDLETRRERLKEAEHSARALQRLLERLLEFVSLETCVTEIETYPFSVRDVLRGLKSTYGDMAEAKGIGLEVQIEPSLKDLRGDGTKLRRILDQLVENAVKFTSEGQVVVHVSQEETDHDTLFTCFIVDDAGPGIPNEMRETVFEPFTQIDGSYTRRYGGTGLGLGIARQLAVCLKAELIVGESPQGGTRMKLCVDLRTA
jgi:PAS domain S-box-containing protein